MTQKIDRLQAHAYLDQGYHARSSSKKAQYQGRNLGED